MNHSFRPLLPDPGRHDRGPPVGTALGRKKAPRKQACEACRSYKTKCSGERPSCGKCLLRSTACRYVETEARQVRRKYEDLRRSASKQDELLSLLTRLPEEDSFKLLRRVRAGEDIGAIVNHVKAGDLLLQMHLVPETRLVYTLPYSRDLPKRLLTSESPYLHSKVYEAALRRVSNPHIRDVAAAQPERRILPDIDELTYQSEFVKPYHSAVLVEPRLEQTKPSKWSNVIKSKDDALMREALAAYFKYEYHLFPAFQKDFFLDDMANVDSDRRELLCCSTLLVNAILAYASFCHSKFSNRFRYWDPDNLGYRFLAEAKRLWELRAINGELHSLASVQAAIVINIVYNIMGLDKLGNYYGLQGIAIARKMQLFNSNAHVVSVRERHARNFTAWCLFDANVHLSWHFFRPPLLAKPPEYVLPDPLTNPNWYGEMWSRYILSPTLAQTRFAYYFKAKSEYLLILHDLAYASFSEATELSAKQAMGFAQRLTEWFANLPTCLSPKDIVLPAHFLLHLDYYIVVITVCQPFIQEQWDNDLNPRNMIIDAEREMNILLRLYYLRHGFSGADSWLTSPLAKIGFLSLQSISTHTNPEDLEYARSSLFLALEGLREQGRNYYISRTVYYIVRNQVRPEEARLLMGVEDRESAADESPGMKGEVQSAWVPRILDISASSLADEELTKLAKQYLMLGDDGKHEDE